MNLDNITEIKRNESDLRLDLTITDTQIDLTKPVVEREVVRGIVVKEHKILLVYPKAFIIYGTPGGGIEAGETKIEALRREMREEAGVLELEVIEYLGKMSAFRKDFHNDKIFSPIHHYYLINILEQGKQELLEYEAELELTCEFVDIDEAINTNVEMMESRDVKFLDFYSNQTILLKELKNVLFKN